MTRLFKSFISTLVAFALVAVLPAETADNTNQVEFAVEQESNDAIFASADVKKKKKKERRFPVKVKRRKKDFSQKSLDLSSLFFFKK